MDDDFYDVLFAEIQEEDVQQEKIKNPSVRLKSALKRFPDYLCNRHIKRTYEHLLEYGVIFQVLQDSSILLSRIWDFLSTSHQGSWPQFFEGRWITYDEKFFQLFREELKMLCMGTDRNEMIWNLQILQSFVSSLKPCLISMCAFLSFCVTIDPSSTPDKLSALVFPVARDQAGVLWVEFSDSFQVGMIGQLILFNLYHEKYLLHRDHLLNWSDKMTERMNVLIFNYISSGVHRESCVSNRDLLKIIQWGDDVIWAYGSSGFNLLSNFEAIVVGVILSKGDKELWDCDKFLRNVISDCHKEIPWSRLFIDRLLHIIRPLDPDQLCDLHGLYRIWGHPEVVIQEGLKKMMKISKAEKILDSVNIQISGRMFKEIFFYNYHKKHHHYPPFSLMPAEPDITPDSYLFSQLLANTLFSISDGGYRLSDWDGVNLKKTFEIPSSWNLAQNIKDKAISPNREELKDSVRRGLGVINQDTRRTVLKWLRLSVIPMRQFLEQIDKFGLPLNELIIGLYAKERELKHYPRFFSLMSFSLRLFVVSSEALIGDKILPYFPQITMSSNLLEMTKKILSLSGKMKGNDIPDNNLPGGRQSRAVSYSINIDFKKWNQQMRYEITEPVFRLIDQLFGWNNVIRRTHTFFSQCLIYLCSGEFTPQFSGDDIIIEEPWCWTGDGSGKEGLRQKGWTIMTVAMIEYVVRQHKGSTNLIGGGDNQVLVVSLQTDELDEAGNITEVGKFNLHTRMKELVGHLDSYFLSVGLPLKLNETWVSPELFMYNKIMCYKGLSLRSCLKTASRAFPFSDDTALTIHGMMSTLGTNIKSLCSRDFSHIPSYVFSRWVVLFACFQFYWFHPLIPGGVKNIPQTTVKISLRDSMFSKVVPKGRITFQELLFNLLYYPRIMGGYAIGIPTEWMMRGFPDPLTLCLSWISQLCSRIPGDHPFIPYLEAAISMSKKAGEAQFLHLVSDPVSINHDGPPHGIARLRQESERAMIESPLVTNRDLREFASICYSENSKQLLHSLCSSKTLEPKFLHEIYSATLYGYFNSIVSRVDKSTTIMRLNHSISINEVIKQSEIEYIAYSIIRGEYDYDLRPSACSRETAQRYRDQSWGRHIAGITVPSPSELFHTGILSSEEKSCDRNYVIVTSQRHSKSPRTRGNFHPYLGSFTDEKFKLSPIAGAFGDEAVLSKAIHLQKLRHWRYKKGTDLYNIITDVLKSETDLDPESLFIMCNYQSSAHHRFSGESLASGAIINSNPDLYRHIFLSTSTLLRRSRGGRNDMIHFQAVLLYISALLVNHYDDKTEVPQVTFHFHELCPTCIVPVEEIPDKDISLSVNWKIPTLPNNPLAYVKSETIQFDYSDLCLIKKYQELQTSCFPDSPLIPRGNIACDAIATDLYLHISGRKSLTASQIRRMADNDSVEVILAKLKTLLLGGEVTRGFTIDSGRVDGMIPLMSSGGIFRVLKRTNIPLPEIKTYSSMIFHKEVLARVLENVHSLAVNHYTSLNLDLTDLYFGNLKSCYPDVLNCIRCMEMIRKSLDEKRLVQVWIGCEFHAEFHVPDIWFSLTEGYQVRSELSSLTPILANPFTMTATPGYRRILTIPSSSIPPHLIPGSIVNDMIALSDITSLLGAVIFFLKSIWQIPSTGASPLFILNGDLNEIFCLLTASDLLQVSLIMQGYLDDTALGCTEYTSPIGIKESLGGRGITFKEDPYKPPSKIFGPDHIIQIITPRTTETFYAKHYIFPISSSNSLIKISGFVTAKYDFYLPSPRVDKSDWCIASYNESGPGSDFSELISYQSQRKSKIINGKRRKELQEIAENSSYPLVLSREAIYKENELLLFKPILSRLDLIMNCQTLITALESRPISSSNFLQGVWRLKALAFIAHLCCILPHNVARRVIGKAGRCRYDSKTRSLKLCSQGNVTYLRHLYQGCMEEWGTRRIVLKITSDSRIFLSNSGISQGEKGIFCL